MASREPTLSFYALTEADLADLAAKKHIVQKRYRKKLFTEEDGRFGFPSITRVGDSIG